MLIFYVFKVSCLNFAQFNIFGDKWLFKFSSISKKWTEPSLHTHNRLKVQNYLLFARVFAAFHASYFLRRLYNLITTTLHSAHSFILWMKRKQTQNMYLYVCSSLFGLCHIVYICACTAWFVRILSLVTESTSQKYAEKLCTTCCRMCMTWHVCTLSQSFKHKQWKYIDTVIIIIIIGVPCWKYVHIIIIVVTHEWVAYTRRVWRKY